MMFAVMVGGVFALAGCAAGDPYDNFIGAWVRDDPDPEVYYVFDEFEIIKEGDKYIWRILSGKSNVGDEFELYALDENLHFEEDYYFIYENETDTLILNREGIYDRYRRK